MNDRPTLLEKIDEALTIIWWVIVSFIIAGTVMYCATHLTDLTSILTFDRLVAGLETK